MFLRMILIRRGITLAARVTGKIKSVFYSLASMMALFVLFLRWFDLGDVLCTGSGENKPGEQGYLLVCGDLCLCFIY